MLLNKNGQLVKTLDFRGTSIELLDKLTAHQLFQIITSAQQLVNLNTEFKASDLAPADFSCTVFKPIIDVSNGDRSIALRLFGVAIKQALIMSPLLFRQEKEGDWIAATYIKETLKF